MVLMVTRCTYLVYARLRSLLLTLATLYAKAKKQETGDEVKIFVQAFSPPSRAQTLQYLTLFMHDLTGLFLPSTYTAIASTLKREGASKDKRVKSFC